MAKIIPIYSPENYGHRIPDQITNPNISKADYFFTPTAKNFYFKNKSGEVTQIKIDFLKVDNLFWNNTVFTP